MVCGMSYRDGWAYWKGLVVIGSPEFIKFFDRLLTEPRSVEDAQRLVQQYSRSWRRRVVARCAALWAHLRQHETETKAST